jgi:hypothetical protein
LQAAGEKASHTAASHYTQWTVDQVGHWLEAVQLPAFRFLFRANRIDGVALSAIERADLDAILTPAGVPMGERLHVWKVRYMLQWSLGALSVT